MAWKLSNWAQSSLRQALTAAATTAYIDADDVDLLPTLTVSDKAKLVIFNASYREIVNITAWNTDGTLTIERAQESTAARDWAAGTVVVHTPTAEILQAVLSATQNLRFSGTGTGTNAYTVNLGAGITIPTLTDGEEVFFSVPNTNTGAVAPTLIVTNGTDSTTSKPIVFPDDVVPVQGDLASGWVVGVRYSASYDAWVVHTDSSYQSRASGLNEGPLPAASRHPNGRLEYWPNGTTFNTPASGTETAAAWYPIYDGTIGAFSITRQTFTLGQTDVPDNPEYFLRWDQSSAGSGSTIRRLRVPIPGVHWRAGDNAVRGLWLKADSARTVTSRVRQYFGTGGSPSADVTTFSVSHNLTTSWQFFTLPGELTSLSGKTIGSNNDDALYLELDLPVNVTMTIDVAMDDLRPGLIPGLSSDTFPLPTWQGGLGGTYATQAAAAAALATAGSLLTQASFNSGNPDLAAIEALAGTSGLAAKIAANTWALRNLAAGIGLAVTNPAGVAGNPTVSLDLNSVATDTIVSSDLIPFLDASESNAANKTTAANFITDLGIVTTARQIIAGTAISGGGTLAADRTLDFAPSELADTASVSSDFLVLSDASAAGAPIKRLASSFITDLGIITSAGGTMTGKLTMNVASEALLISHATSPYITVTDTTTPVSQRIQCTDSLAYLGSVTNHPLVLTSNDIIRARILASGEIHAEANVGPTSVYSMGYRGVPRNRQDGSYGLVLADAGHLVICFGTGSFTYTIPSNASIPYPIGTTMVLVSGGSATITVAITTDSLYWGGVGTTGSRTVGVYGIVTIVKVDSTLWWISGTALS